MPRVFVPPMLRPLTYGASELDVPGATVGQVIDVLDNRFPGLRERLCDGDDLQPGLSVAVDGSLSSVGLLAKLETDSEVHFLPAISGG